jgi:hypothetical protein
MSLPHYRTNGDRAQLRNGPELPGRSKAEGRGSIGLELGVQVAAEHPFVAEPAFAEDADLLADAEAEQVDVEGGKGLGDGLRRIQADPKARDSKPATECTGFRAVRGPVGKGQLYFKMKSE